MDPAVWLSWRSWNYLGLYFCFWITIFYNEECFVGWKLFALKGYPPLEVCMWKPTKTQFWQHRHYWLLGRIILMGKVIFFFLLLLFGFTLPYVGDSQRQIQNFGPLKNISSTWIVSQKSGIFTSILIFDTMSWKWRNVTSLESGYWP